MADLRVGALGVVVERQPDDVIALRRGLDEKIGVALGMRGAAAEKDEQLAVAGRLVEVDDVREGACRSRSR
jgi:hypothetical protein